MSARPAIVALILTVLLAVATWLVVRPRPSAVPLGPGAGQRVLPIDLASVTRITISTGQGPLQSLDRHAGGRWHWSPDASVRTSYALEDARARAFLRLLAELTAAATPPPGQDALPESPPPVTITLADPSGPTILRMAPRALGGQVLAEVVTPRQSVRTILPEQVLSVVTNPGPSAWRDTRPMAGLGPIASRVRFTDGTGTKGFGLARREGRWILTPPAPVAAPAAIDAVSAVLGTVESISITRFFDASTAPDPQASGLGTPSATLVIERDEPGPAGGPPTTVTHTLITGQPADTSARTLYASLDGGVTVFAIDAGPLARLTADPSVLASRTSAQTLAVDVGGVRLTGPSGRTIALHRDSAASPPRWTETVDGQDPVTLDPTRAAAAAETLNLATTVGADEVSFTAPAGAQPIGTLTLVSPSGNPLEVLDLLQAPGSQGLILRAGPPGPLATTGGVYRTYAKPPADLMARLERLR